MWNANEDGKLTMQRRNWVSATWRRVLKLQIVTVGHSWHGCLHARQPESSHVLTWYPSWDCYTKAGGKNVVFTCDKVGPTSQSIWILIKTKITSLASVTDIPSMSFRLSEMFEIEKQLGKRKLKGGIVVIKSQQVSSCKGSSTDIGTVLVERWPEDASQRALSWLMYPFSPLIFFITSQYHLSYHIFNSNVLRCHMGRGVWLHLLS